MPIQITELINQPNAVENFLKKNKTYAYTQKELMLELELDQSTVARQLKKSSVIRGEKNYNVKGKPFYYYYQDQEEN